MPTIKEIAQICGVSTATVSKALNGYTDIGTDTAQMVKKVANEIGYFPDASARALKTNYSNNLGILFIDKTKSGLAHQFFSPLLESFKSRAEELGYDITFISRNLGGRKMSYLDHCLYRRVDGVIIASVDFNDPDVIQLVESKIPVVTIDHVFNNRSVVVSDNVAGALHLANYICSKGHKKIAFIHGEDGCVTQKRLAGFHRSLAEHGIKIPPEYIKAATYLSPSNSARATRELMSLPTPPTCILYPDDFSFVGGMSELESMGLRIPEDISVAGYDGICFSQVLRPRLTTLKQDSYKMGREAADELVNSVKEPKTHFPRQIIVQGRLLQGESVMDISCLQ